jgi:hypothetical protein
MRLDECQQVRRDLSDALGINLTVVDASQRFLDGLKGVEDPEVAPPPLIRWCLLFTDPPCRKSASSSVCPGFSTPCPHPCSVHPK